MSSKKKCALIIAYSTDLNQSKRLRTCCSKGPHTCPNLHIYSVIPTFTAGVWQQVHQQFTRTFFFNGKEEVSDFSGVRGWPFLFRWRIVLERRAGAQHCAQEAALSRTIGEITAPGTKCAAPRLKERSKIWPILPGALPWTSSRVNGQPGVWLRLPLASTPLRVWGGSGRGRGRGATPRRETTSRREEGAGSLRRFQPEGAVGLATAPRTS